MKKQSIEREFRRLKEEREKDKRKIGVLEGITRMKSEFISVLSHELRTPLAVAKQSVALMIGSLKKPLSRRQRLLLTRAQTSLGRLEKVTEGLLDISRMQRGTFKLEYSLVNLKDLIKDLGAGFRELAREKGVSVRLKLPSRTVNTFIDTERVNQVLSNLLDNALKFTNAGGNITLELVVLENKVRIGVIDTGIGISSKDLPFVFRKLVQVTQPAKPTLRSKGMGLGLAISKELVERHGGEIWAESEPKLGSKFYFTLPRFYSGNVLDNVTRKRINQLLEQDITLHLINLVVVNYAGFRRLVKAGRKGVEQGLRDVVRTTVKDFRRSRSTKQFDIYLTRFHRGECTILFTEGSEADVARLCNCLRTNIDRFLKRFNFSELFINIGVLEFLYKSKSVSSRVVPASIYIKKIFIGAEKRKQARYNYQIPLEPFSLQACLGPSYTLDVSDKGLCFLSSRQLKTDSRVLIKLVIPRVKRLLSLRGRVAWIAPVERIHPADPQKYKIGVEFVQLKQKDAKAFLRFIKSVKKSAAKTGKQ